jgi:hypothetical protein
MQTILRFTLAVIGMACLLFAAPARAQTFTNSDLETWSMRNGVEAPTNWLTTDDLLGLPLSLGTVTKTTDRRTGAFAAKLETVANPILMFTVPALMIVGTRINSRTGLPGGTPFTGRPAQLQFYYKLTGPSAAGDSAEAVVVLTRTINGQKTPIAGGSEVISVPRSTYGLMTVPISYSSGAAPDSAHIIFTSGTSNTPTAGTALYIDDVSFTGTATATVNNKLQTAVNVFPNPSSNGTFMLSTTEPALLAAPFSVTDATGRVIVRGTEARPASTRAVDLSRQPAGIYTLQLQTAQGLVTRKLVVQ